jgi:two-component system KDP operon response regulator KdpE
MPAVTVLIIDDEPQIRRLLRTVLESADWRTIEAANGADGIREAATRLPDVILLDLGLPGMGGMDVLRRLREWSDVPVLILSVQDSGEDKVLALDEGADDYVTKPFDSQELLARMRVLLRRKSAPEDPILELGPLTVDFPERLVRVHGREIELTPTEYNLLRVLARHAGKIVTQKQLLTAVWGPNAADQSQYLRVFMSHIRRKLTAAGMVPNPIRTETGVGYRLIVA